MRKLLRWIGRRLGVVNWYHVAATYPLPGGGFATLTMTCSVRPWLHHDNYAELTGHMHEQAGRPAVRPNIVSITRLGP